MHKRFIEYDLPLADIPEQEYEDNPRGAPAVGD